MRLSPEALALLREQSQTGQKPTDRPKRLPIHITVTDDKEGKATIEENTLLGTASRRRHDLSQMLNGTHPDQKETGGSSFDWSKAQLKTELGGSVQVGGKHTGYPEDSRHPIETAVSQHINLNSRKKPTKKPGDDFNNPGFLGE